MARSKQMPEQVVVLTDPIDFYKSFQDYQSETSNFERSLIDQIQLECKSYWTELLAECERKKSSVVTAKDQQQRLLRSMFIYFNPKFQKCTRNGKTNYYVYWAKGTYGFYKKDRNIKRMTEQVSPKNKATTMTVATYEFSQFDLPPEAEWQREYIEKYEQRFFVLRQILKFVQLNGSTLAAASAAFDTTESDIDLMSGLDTLNEPSSKHQQLSEIASILTDNNNDPDKLTPDQVKLLFSVDDDELEANGIKPFVKKVYTGISY